MPPRGTALAFANLPYVYHLKYMTASVGISTTAVRHGRAGRVAFVSSAGGVLRDVLTVANSWPDSVGQIWFAPRSVDTESALADRTVTWMDEPADSPTSMLRATAHARTTIQSHRIDWVVSAGTALALPFFVAAKGCGASTLWIETLNIHGEQGRVAEVCSRLATRTLVQSPDRLLAHRRALLVGELQ